MDLIILEKKNNGCATISSLSPPHPLSHPTVHIEQKMPTNVRRSTRNSRSRHVCAVDELKLKRRSAKKGKPERTTKKVTHQLLDKTAAEKAVPKSDGEYTEEGEEVEEEKVSKKRWCGRIIRKRISTTIG